MHKKKLPKNMSDAYNKGEDVFKEANKIPLSPDNKKSKKAFHPY